MSLFDNVTQTAIGVVLIVGIGTTAVALGNVASAMLTDWLVAECRWPGIECVDHIAESE